MAELALAAAQTLFAALECGVIKDVCSMWGYASEVEDLKKTVSTIQTLFLDADAQPQLSQQQNHYIEQLKDVVFEADDFFDEIRTLAELKQLHKPNKLSDKVRHLFSSKHNPLARAFRLSEKIKKIKKELEGIVTNHTMIGVQFDSTLIGNRKPDTCSYVYAPNIVGRENDVNAVIDRILGPIVGEGVGFLTIVGPGGLGKTALAQLVYDDQRVKHEFPLRLWGCVADQGTDKFDIKTILSKILKSTSSSMEELAIEFRTRLGGKKCFLVLDDIWNEDRCEWDHLKGFLMSFGAGSKIMATSRSEVTARVIGDGDTFTYELKGLSDDDSYRLFRLSAFEKGHELEIPEELAIIGKKIVKQCHQVPLVIKVVGSLLYGQGKTKWRDFEENGLDKITQGEEKIMSVLKLSYNNLECSLKSCFAYCALFPKDFVIEKNMLTRLWLAQGYVKPLYGGQHIEAAAEDHFSILLRRCFFQDVIMDVLDDVKSCKIHDLMHDVALEVVGKHIFVASTMNISRDLKVCHVFEDRVNVVLPSYCKRKIRSYVHVGCRDLDSCIPLDSLNVLVQWGCLRSLSLRSVTFETLPDSIRRLLHLRLLDLSYCRRLKRLPNSITKIHNLQSLILRSCLHLEELPKELWKLINLRYLDIHNTKVYCMPTGMDKLSSLRVLTSFNVGGNGNQSGIGRLRELRALSRLTGGIEIKIDKRYIEDEVDDEVGYLSQMEQLNSISIWFQLETRESEERGEDVLLRKLQPHPNIREVFLLSYEGREIGWGGRSKHNWALFFPNLVTIGLYGCPRLKQVPMLRELVHLKTLLLCQLYEIEYMEEEEEEDRRMGCGDAASCSTQPPFYPSLQTLTLGLMEKMKGWWRRKGVDSIEDDTWLLPSFPRLSRLHVEGCPRRVIIPPGLTGLVVWQNGQRACY